jgi:hypothetical protein
MVGAWLVAAGAAALTTIEKAGSDTLVAPSVTLITMFASVPASAFEGVPASAPVAVLKLAHEGMFVIEKTSAPPFPLAPVGVNE